MPKSLTDTVPAWPEEIIAARLDKCASMLFLHGYIPLGTREKIHAKLVKQVDEARAHLKDQSHDGN